MRELLQLIFSKVCEKKKIKKNTKNIRQTLKALISVMAGWIRLKFWMECFLPRGTFHSKNGAVLFRYYRVTDALKQFLYNTHLFVARPHWLYLAAQHAIVCLDIEQYPIRQLSVGFSSVNLFPSPVECQAIRSSCKKDENQRSSWISATSYINNAPNLRTHGQWHPRPN